MSFKIIQPKSPFKQRSISPVQKRNNHNNINHHNINNNIKQQQQFGNNSYNDDTFDNNYNNVNFKLSRIIENEQFQNKHLIEPEPLDNIKEIARDILDLAQNHQDDNDHNIDPLETVNRLMHAEHKKKEKLLNKQLNIYMEEIAEMQSGLKVNAKSEHILRNKNYQPIHLRTEEVIQQKQDKIFKLFQQYQEEKELKEPMPSFQPNLDKQNPVHNKRTLQEFLTHMDNWTEKKNRNKQICHYQVITQQMENTTFKPQINKKSLQILKEKNKNCENGDLAKRMEIKSKELEQKKKQLEQQVKDQYSYTPKINVKSKRLASRSQNRKNYDHPTAASHSRSPPKNNQKFEITLPKKNQDTSPRTMVKSKSSVSVRMSQSQIKSNILKQDEQIQINNQNENILPNNFQESHKNINPNQSYSNDFRVDDIANNREEILRKLSDYDKFKNSNNNNNNNNSHQYLNNTQQKLLTQEDYQQQQNWINQNQRSQQQSNKIQSNQYQQDEITHHDNMNEMTFSKQQFLEQVQSYNLQKQYSQLLDSNYGQNYYQRSSSPLRYNNHNNNNNINQNQNTYFQARKKSQNRLISPNENKSNSLSKYNHQMTQSPTKGQKQRLQQQSQQLQQQQQQENQKPQNGVQSSKDSVNQVLYHPNLDFIIGILSKKDKPKH